jgi:hypothetical protein
MPKYRTMQGKEIDMDKLMAQNELMPAIGNMKVNARGDELGPGGKIVRKREDVMAQYYEANPKSRANKIKPEIKENKEKSVTQNIKGKKPQVKQNED